MAIKNVKILILNPPSPPYYDICREWAGGFGIAWYRGKRKDYGQSDDPILQPCLPYISAILAKEGYEFKVLDCQVLRLNRFQVLKDVAKESPDIVLSLIGLPSLRRDLELLKSIKETVPNTLIVGMGTTCRVIPCKVLLYGSVDVVLRGDYPYVSNLTRLIETFRREKNFRRVFGISYVNNGKVIKTPESPELNLNSIPPPFYVHCDPSNYHSTFTDITGERHNYVPILGSKGCPYACIYCPYPLGFGKKWTYRSPKDIVNEIEYLHTLYNINGFLFRDQSFTMSQKHAVEVCNEIIQRRLNIAWFCEARVDEVSKPLLEKMKDAGCKRIHYGVETGDPKLIGLGKPGVSLGTVRRAFRLTKDVGIWRTAHVILGWPDETFETLERTYKFVLSLSPDDVNWNTLTPYPGTRLYEVVLRDSLILTHDWSMYTPDMGTMRTKNLTAVQLSAAKKAIKRNFMKYKAKKLLLEIVSGRRKPKLSMNGIKEMIKFYVSQGLE